MSSKVVQLAAFADVLCFQEVHGREGEVSSLFGRLLPGWKILVSSPRSMDGLQQHKAGGVVIAVAPHLKDLATFEDHFVIPGRCIGISISIRGKCLTVINLHNYGLFANQVRAIGRFMSSLAVGIKASPHCLSGLLVGDLNIKAEHERTFKVGRVFAGGARDRVYSNPLFSGQLLRLWGQILEGWTEVIQPFPTHFDAKGNSCSRIDRAWVCGPSSLLIKLRVMSFVISSPEELFGEGLSDHAPLVLSFGKVVPSCNTSFAIPKHICKTPAFVEGVESLVADCGLFEQPKHKRLELYKICMKESARRVKLDLIHKSEDELKTRRLVLASISRAIWFNNIGLAKKLLNTSIMARDILILVGRRVLCRDFSVFDDWFNDSHQKLQQQRINGLKGHIAATNCTILKKQLRSKVQAACRLQKVFWPTGKRLIVTGIIGANDVHGNPIVHTKPCEIQEALRSYWGEVYSKKEMDGDRAHKLINFFRRKCGHLFDFENLEVPDEEKLEKAISLAKDSACGPDGVPYAAYKALRKLSATILRDSIDDLQLEMPQTDLERLNEQFVWMAPKAPSANDGVVVLRTPNNLRTIFGSNADSKLIASATAYELVEPTLAVTPLSQRGFCRGRQLGVNIVDIDVFMHVFNSIFSANSSYNDVASMPGTPLYDFCNAFPTLLHEWLFLMLRCYKLPRKFRFLIFNMYQKIKAYTSGVGDNSWIFDVLGGVKTGCPLSSLLFLLCINPFVYMFESLSDGPGHSITRVCADDFASALLQLRTLFLHSSIFNLARKVAGLHLKPSKCVLIISCMFLSDDLKYAIRNWLVENIPEFSEFAICSYGKYLGWWLGVDSVNISYKAPLVKFVHRGEEVVGGKAPATTSIVRYNQRCIPVLSYVAQFAPPPSYSEPKLM